LCGRDAIGFPFVLHAPLRIVIPRKLETMLQHQPDKATIKDRDRFLENEIVKKIVNQQ
jgi:hypothetical protein